MPVGSVEGCAEAIVNSACRGDRYLTHPAWMRTTYFWQVFCPEMVEWLNRFFLMTGPGISQRDALSMKIVHLANGLKGLLYQDEPNIHDELKA